MAVLAFLLHPVQHLVGFPAGGFIHAGLGDLLLEHAHIGDILRVHVIKLLLEKVDLLSQGVLPVELLIGFLGMLLRFIRNIGDCDKAVDRFFDQVKALRDPVRLQDPVLFFRSQIQIGRERGRAFLQTLPAVQISPGH